MTVYNSTNKKILDTPKTTSKITFNIISVSLNSLKKKPNGVTRTVGRKQPKWGS